MGIINRNRPKNGKNAGTTVLAGGSELVGHLTLDDNLHIDGVLDGTIESKAEVIIGQSGRMEGQIKAQRVLVSGSFQGKIEADRLEIVATGKVTGEVTVGQLVVESGAHFNGSSRIRGDEPPRQITHDKAATSDQRDSDQQASGELTETKSEQTDSTA